MVSRNGVRPKDQNLCPIRNCKVPGDVSHLKSFLGATQQLADYCDSYAIIAAPLHFLTKKNTVFPKPWLQGTDYAIAFDRIKSMMLDGARFLFHKDSNKRLFIEVDASDTGYGFAAYQYEDILDVADEGRHEAGNPMAFQSLDNPRT